MGKRVLYGSIGLMAIVAALTVTDLATGWIFARYYLMDGMLLAGAAMVIYMAIDALKDQK